MAATPDPHARDPARRLRRGRIARSQRLDVAGHREALRRLRETLRAQRFDVEPDEPDDERSEPSSEPDAALDKSQPSAEPAGRGDDALPEHTRYRDDGCHVAPACLSCPLDRCVFDRRGTERQAVRRSRNRQIRTLTRRGWSTAALVVRFGLSPAQVRRIRAGGRSHPRRPRHPRLE